MDRRFLLMGAASAVDVAAVDRSAAADSDEAELCYMPATELLALFRTRKLSPVDVLKAQVRRIEALNGKVNCITYGHFDQAMEEASQSEAHYRRGAARPLEGLTVAIKDENDRAGWRTTMGSLILKDAPPAKENAAIIDALEAAGAVMHIQTTVPEFYLSATASSLAWGTTGNPWNLHYSPGGSSGGSAAALAAGFTTLATGSDMGGSIRIPASQCGLWGFKPPFGRVPTSEVAFETLGPLARTFDDMTLMQKAIVGPSPKVHSSLRPKLVYPPRYGSVRGWKIAIDWGKGIAALDPAVGKAMTDGLAILRRIGCSVDEVDCGFSRDQFLVMLRGLMSTSMGMLLVIAERHPDQLSPYVRRFLEQNREQVGPTQANEADELIERVHRRVQERVFEKGYRALVMPTIATPYFAADAVSDKSGASAAAAAGYAMTWPWNLLSRYPVVDMPLGLTPKNMPTGMQIVSNTFDDLAAFRLAAACSAAAQPLYRGVRFPTFTSMV